MNKLRFFFIALSFLFGSALLSLAQTASIQGTVFDKAGAVVNGAEVVVRNVATGQTRTTTSSGTGFYSLTTLPVGAYQIEIKKESFKGFKVQNAQLSVDQVLTVNATLDPGQVSEEVQVRADQLPPVDLDTAQVSNLVEARQIKDLPLITRDPYSLVLLSPGTAQTNSRLGGFTVNGARERNNNFLLDGVDNNDTSVPGGAGGVLSANPDSTEEFRVITNNFNAESGRNTGAIIDVVTKSGTNNFHGSAYEFGRWNGFGGARDWFNRETDLSGNHTKQDPYVRNQFGYSVGGPIIKNKTFFFFNNEFQRFRTTLTNSATVPTAAFKSGIFDYTAPDQTTGQMTTTHVDLTPTGANNAFGAPLDATMQQIFALYPNPLSSPDGLSGTVFFPSSSQQNSYQTVAKIDHRFTDRHAISIRYGYNHFFDPNPSHADILPGNVGGVDSKQINQGVAANLTSSFTNTLINSFIFGWNKVYANFGCTGLSVLDSVSPVDAFGNGRDYNISPFTSFGCLDLVANSQWRKTGTTSFADSISWVKGSHSLKFGFDFRNVGEQGPNSFFSRRQVGLDQAFQNFGFSLINAPSNDSVALENAAAGLYGFVSNDFAGEFFDKNGVRQGTDNKLFRQHEYDWFGQDSWKVIPNLTLTLGVRYQLDGVPYEEHANFSNLLSYPGTTFPVVMSIVGPGTGNQVYHTDYSNIEPRIGFSWDPWNDGKTAVRGAFGIFHDRVFGNLFGNARGNPPFEQDYQHFPFETLNNAFGGAIGGELVPSVVPNTTPSATIPDYDPFTNVGALGPVLFDPHFRNLASNNWNLGIQREMPGNNTIDVSYIGSKGTHIYRALDGNPPDPNRVAQLVAFCVPTNPLNTMGCTSSDVSSTNLYLGAQFGVLPFNAVAHNALFQPAYNQSVANSIYNSLQMKVTHRLSHGLQFHGSYTWAHSIDNASDPIDPAQNNRTFPRNSLDLAQDRGNSDNDVRQTGVVDYIWEVPFGRGKAYLNNGVIGRVFEGMQFSGITTVQTGHPFELRCTRDSQRTGIAQWCDLTGDPWAPGSNDDPAQSAGTKVYFRNPAAFAQPAFGRPGTIGRNQLYGPGFVNFDLAFAKNIRMTERVGLELRIEGYNIFNHPHFQQPDNLFTSPTFGLITATASRPDATTSARQMQVGLKLNF
jgi:Carboxypeptidase regulatory-like domain